jgi:DNA-binding response OmpR family regulator
VKLLVIDDNKEITDLFKEYLSAKGHDCIIANDGRSGLEVVNKNKLDAVILDIAMPDFTGYDVVNELEKTGKIKEHNVIVLTASDIVNENDIARLKKQGVKTFLKKPVKLDSLIREIISQNHTETK